MNQLIYLNEPQYYCKNGHSANLKDFYLRKDKTPISTCKQCIKEQLDIEDPTTFLWILKEVDVPYVDTVWAGYKEQTQDKRCLGKYLAAMKLTGFRHYTYKDSRKLNSIPYDKPAYKIGKKDAAQEILDYIETLCYSTDPDRVKFRADYGSKGVKDSIIAFIQSKFLE